MGGECSYYCATPVPQGTEGTSEGRENQRGEVKTESEVGMEGRNEREDKRKSAG